MHQHDLRRACQGNAPVHDVEWETCSLQTCGLVGEQDGHQCFKKMNNVSNGPGSEANVIQTKWVIANNASTHVSAYVRNHLRGRRCTKRKRA